MTPPPALSEAAEHPAFVAPAPRAAVRPVEGTLAAILLIIASTVFFSSSDVVAKWMTETMSPIEVTWMRYVVFLALIGPAAVAAHGTAALRTGRPGLQVLRGLAVVVSALFFMSGLGYLPVAETTAINFISPVFITALSIPLLGERVGLRRWIAALVGFGGVMVIVRPGTDAFQMAALFPVAAASVWAGAAIATRMMSRERPETTLFYSAVVGLAVLSVMVMFHWQTPTMNEVKLGILMGLGSTAGHWLLVQAYRRAPASLLAPFSYVQLVFASGFAYLAFGELPGPWTFAGGAIIAASGLYTAHRERIRAREV